MPGPKVRSMTDWDRFREIAALRDSGHPADALVEFRNLRASAGDAEEGSAILLGEALCHRELGRLDEAAEAASEAIRLLAQENPSRPYAEFSLACVHESQGNLDLATQEYRALLKRHADLLRTDEYAEFRRGVQHRLIENLIVLEHGIEPLSIAATLKAEDISLEERAELSYWEAQAHQLLERHDQALTLYQEAISGPLQSSLAARAHFHIGEIEYDRGEFSKALKQFKNAEQLAEAANPDRELFTKWIEHASQCVVERLKSSGQ